MTADDVRWLAQKLVDGAFDRFDEQRSKNREPEDF